MPLILAIEPDRRQAARISTLARERLHVELVVVDSAERALKALSERVPDLILTSLLLSGKDEAALDERLRQLDAAGSHVQTLMIPMLASTGRRTTKKDGLLNRLRRAKDDEPATEGGCDPAVFAAQIAEYLEKAADEHADRAALAEQDRAYRVSEPAPPVAAEAASRIENVAAEVPAAEPYEFAFPQVPQAPVESEFGISSAPAYSDAADVPASVSTVADSPFPLYEPPASFDLPPTASFSLPPAASFDQPPAAFLDQQLAASFDQESATAFDVEPAGFSNGPVPTASRAWPSAEHVEPAAFEAVDSFGEFIKFEELGVVDAPTIALGEFADAMERFETEGAWDSGAQHRTADAGSVLDALEVLDEPEIPDLVDFQPPHREAKRRPAPVSMELTEAIEPDPTEPDFDFEGNLWMPLPIAAARRWPVLEGPTVKATFAPGFDAPPDPGVEFAAPPPPSDRGAGKKRKNSKPAQDEWGFFDPVQCGFAALLAKLDEVTDKE